MKYAGIIYNDMCAAPGISVSVYLQGCPHHCKGCHNPETWDFNGGKEFTYDVLNEIIDALTARLSQSNTASTMSGSASLSLNSVLTVTF